MKSLIAGVVLAIALTSVGGTQQLKDPDFAIPESPAFQMIDTSGTRILRPATVRELAVEASNFTSGGSSFAIPRNFAMEVAPVRLIARGTLNSDSIAAKNRVEESLYRLRLSVATKSTGTGGSNGPMAAAIGVRWNLRDDADLRTTTARNQAMPKEDRVRVNEGSMDFARLEGERAETKKKDPVLVD